MSAAGPTSRATPKAWLAIVALLLLAGWWLVSTPEPDLGPADTQVERAAPRTPASPAARQNSNVDSGARSNEETYDLSRDEARGGHTLARHVGRSDRDLAARLEREPGIGAASTYTDRSAAERTVARALARSRDRIQAWAQRGARRPNLALTFRGSEAGVIGRTLVRGRTTAEPATDAVVVLRADGAEFFVLTTYPERRR